VKVLRGTCLHAGRLAIGFGQDGPHRRHRLGLGASGDRLDLYSAADARSPSWKFLGTLTPGGAAQQTLSMTFVLPSGSVQAIRGVFRYGGSASLCGSGPYDDRDDLVFAVQ
jgi:leucyl aminopeptidase